MIQRGVAHDWVRSQSNQSNLPNLNRRETTARR